MPAFCSSCGVKTSPSDRFCGGCGASLVQYCPTCGQVWDGVEVGQNSAPSPTPTERAVAPAKKVVTAREPEVEVVKVPTRPNARLTSAAIDPVYGTPFNYKTDCPNCGAKGQKNQICKVCGYNQ